MSFINTRDTIGDQATLDGLVEHTLTELKEDAVTSVPAYTFYHNDVLQRVEMPNVGTIKTSAFDGCTALTTASFPNVTGTRNSRAFYECSSLTSVDLGTALSAING